MRKSIVFVAIVALLVLSVQVFGAGVDLTGVGARAMALGGNYRAVAQGWSAMYWNPAGLVFNDKIVGGVSLEFVKPTVGYTPAKSLAGLDFSGTTGAKVENDPTTFLLPSAGIAYNTGKFAFGLGFWAPFGLGAKWDLIETSTYNSAYPEYDFEDDLKIIDIHPTIAYKISDKLSIGVGASIVMADIMIRKANFTPNPYMFSEDLTGNALLQLGFYPNMTKLGALVPPFDHLLTDSELKGDGMGFGGNVGIMFKPTKSLSIGLEAKIYNDISLEGTMSATTYFADLPKAHEAVQPIANLVFKPKLAAGEIDETTYAVLANYYSGGQYVRADAMPLKTSLPLPKRIGAGIAYTGIQKLLITADVAWTEWSSWDIIELKNDEDVKVSQLVENWKDGIRAGIGLEYQMSTFKLRGAFYSEPPAAIAETMTPVIPDAGRRNVAGIGMELPFGKFRLHVSYEKMFIEKLTVEDWVLTADQTGYDNMAGMYEMNVNNLMIGFD